jgi:type VI secretion system protein ImpH
MSLPDAPYRFDEYPDLKFEFILGELMESGLDPDVVVINALGIFRRKFGKDVAAGEIREYMTSRRQYVSIDINRDGIYDLLPMGLFHQPQSRVTNITAAQAIEEYRLQKQIEKDTRLFFLPFEQELYRLLLLLETEERKSIFDIQNVFRSQVFIDFWNIPDFFNERQTCNLLYLLPLASFIAGNYNLTKYCLESILNDRFEIIESPPANHIVSETGFADLNSIYLGVNFVIGENYREVSTGLDVFIHPTLAENIISYLDGGEKLKMLQFMFDYFLPFDCDVTTHIVSDEIFELREESGYSRLGINTLIRG